MSHPFKWHVSPRFSNTIKLIANLRKISNFAVSNSLGKCHLNSVWTQYVNMYVINSPGVQFSNTSRVGFTVISLIPGRSRYIITKRGTSQPITYSALYNKEENRLYHRCTHLSERTYRTINIFSSNYHLCMMMTMRCCYIPTRILNFAANGAHHRLHSINWNKTQLSQDNYQQTYVPGIQSMLYLLIVWWGLPDFIMPQIDWWLRWLVWMLNQCHSLTSIGPSQIAKVMGPTWVLSAPDGPHVGPMILAIRDFIRAQLYHFLWFSNVWWHHDMDILLLIIGPLWRETTVTCVFPS